MKKIVSISWRPEVLEALDAYIKKVSGGMGGLAPRSVVVNNMIERELRASGHMKAKKDEGRRKVL